LRKAAGELLRKSPEFQRLMRDLNARLSAAGDATAGREPVTPASLAPASRWHPNKLADCEEVPDPPPPLTSLACQWFASACRSRMSTTPLPSKSPIDPVADRLLPVVGQILKIEDVHCPAQVRIADERRGHKNAAGIERCVSAE